jgi:hypothetical protein
MRVDKEGKDATEALYNRGPKVRRQGGCSQSGPRPTGDFFGVHIGKGDLAAPPFGQVFFSRRNA